MKTLILIFLLASLSVFSKENISLMCTSRTTDFLIQENQSQVTLKLTHHHGPRFTPIYNGPVMSYDIAELKASSKTLKKFPNVIHFSWKAKNCTSAQINIFECLDGSALQINGENFKALALNSKIVTIDFAHGQQRLMHLTLKMMSEKTKTVHYFTSQYALKTCFK
jgi:hypothetical protein